VYQTERGKRTKKGKASSLESFPHLSKQPTWVVVAVQEYHIVLHFAQLYHQKMCFNGHMSLAFSACGLYATWWIKNKTKNNELAAGKNPNPSFYFPSMLPLDLSLT
jgi:hypothetical protein